MSEAPSAGHDFARLVARTTGLQPWRRAFHAGNGLVVALAPGAFGASRVQVVWLLAGAFALLVAFDLARLRADRLNTLFFRSFPSLVSPREAFGLASSTWYALGALLTWAIFPVGVAVPAILVLALADPAASVTGRLLKSPRVGSGSLFGCTVFFLVAAALLIPFVGVPAGLAGAAVAAVVEATPWRLDDNLTIPLAVATVLSLLAL